jgi:hypothetical protein
MASPARREFAPMTPEQLHDFITGKIGPANGKQWAEEVAMGEIEITLLDETGLYHVEQALACREEANQLCGRDDLPADIRLTIELEKTRRFYGHSN